MTPDDETPVRSAETVAGRNLRSDDLYDLAWNLHRQWCNSSHHNTSRCKADVAKGGLDWRKARDLAPTVGGLIAAALLDAANDPSLRLSGHSGVSITRLRERANTYVTSPGGQS